MKKIKSIVTLSFTLLFALSVFAAPISAAAANAAPKKAVRENTAVVADTVYINGNIYTVDKNFSSANAMAVKGQKILYVGTNAKAKKYVGKKTKVVDLKKKTVLPGLIEGHMHIPMLGENLIKIDAFNKPKADILALVKAEVEIRKPGEWITGFGWNQELWAEKAFPSKAELDAVAPNNPVMLERVDSHSIWVNSKALELGGITKDTANPQGGEIQRDAKGEATGILVDTAAVFVTSKIPALTDARKKEALLKAQAQLFENGLTSAMDAGSPVKAINLAKDLYQEGKLKVRIYQMVGGNWGESPGENATAFYKTGPEIGLYNDRYTIRAIKFFTDGSLGSRSAALLADYSDRAGHRGNLKFTDDEFYTMVKEARVNGWQVATHAIGDAAVRQVINTYEKVLTEMPQKDHRWRIEHFQIAAVSDIPRLATLGILPAMQPTHATSDKNMAESRIGAERMKGAYAWRTVIDSGSIIIGGSDAPVELVNPFRGIYAAVTRMDTEGSPAGGWYPEQKMTRVEALKAFTIWAATGQFEEKIKGSLEKNKLADFIIVDRDPMKCPESELKDVKVLKTILGGETVYTAK